MKTNRDACTVLVFVLFGVKCLINFACAFAWATSFLIASIKS